MAIVNPIKMTVMKEKKYKKAVMSSIHHRGYIAKLSLQVLLKSAKQK